MAKRIRPVVFILLASCSDGEVHLLNVIEECQPEWLDLHKQMFKEHDIVVGEVIPDIKVEVE